MQISSGPIGTIDPHKTIHVYGAGIAGLLIGYYLKKNGHIVRIYEKANRVGGKIGTTENQYGIAETAANAIYTNDDVFELINELKLDYTPATPKLKKKVWRDGKAKSPPFKWRELFVILFRIFKRVPFNNAHTLSVADFFNPLTGSKFTEEVISSALGGIYAEDAQRLHFQSIFKLPLKAFSYFSFFQQLIKSRKGPTQATSISFAGGMQTFIDSLQVSLKENIYLNESTSLDSGVNNIICTDAINASQILQSSLPKVSALLNEIQYNSLQTSTFITSTPVSFLEKSFGVLFPQNLKQKAIGLLNNSAIFPNRTKEPGHTSYTMITKCEQLSEHEALKEFLDCTNLDNKDIIFQQTTPWPVAIPIYDQNRFNTIMSIRTQMIDVPAGTVIFGNYIDGISIREMVSMAKNFAKAHTLNKKQKETSLEEQKHLSGQGLK